MHRRRIATVLLVFAMGALVGAAVPVLGESPAVQVTNLLTVALSPSFTPDHEVLIDLVEIPPNQKLDWHRHPGEEFHYYLEGDPVIELGDAPPIIGKPGTVGHVAFEQRHRASAGDKGAKIVVFRVHTKGAPWRYPDVTQEQKGTRDRNLGGLPGGAPVIGMSSVPQLAMMDPDAAARRRSGRLPVD